VLAKHRHREGDRERCLEVQEEGGRRSGELGEPDDEEKGSDDPTRDDHGSEGRQV